MATKFWLGETDSEYATAANWVGASAPAENDSVVFPAMATPDGENTFDVAGSDQSGTTLVDFTVEPECYVNFGSRSAPLQLDVDYFEFQGAGRAVMELRNTTEIQLRNGAAGSTDGSYGFLLTTAGTNALLGVDIGDGNSLGVAPENTQSAAITTIQVLSGNVVLGDGVTHTSFYMLGGAVFNSSDCTNLYVNGGEYTQVKNKPTTITLRNGTLNYNSTDAPTTVNLYGGVLDFSGDQQAKNWSGVTVNIYGAVEIRDPNKVLTWPDLTFQAGGTLSFATA